MLLLQFSTSHYCRKARLALGYQKVAYQVENLTPGLHILRLKPLTGLTTVPVLMPQLPEHPTAIADSTRILRYLETHYGHPSLSCNNPEWQQQADLLEDWLDESIGTATRFVYYQFRAGEGKSIDPSLASQVVIQVVRSQYGINEATAKLAEERLALALKFVDDRWYHNPYLVGDRLSFADIAAAALLSPLALLPPYRRAHPRIFDRIAEIHNTCHEPLPPGL